ncbi:MAG: hypothetical protein ACU0GG_16310 [Paracoccaceae bacterium]
MLDTSGDTMNIKGSANRDYQPDSADLVRAGGCCLVRGIADLSPLESKQ